MADNDSDITSTFGGGYYDYDAERWVYDTTSESTTAPVLYNGQYYTQVSGDARFDPAAQHPGGVPGGQWSQYTINTPEYGLLVPVETASLLSSQMGYGDDFLSNYGPLLALGALGVVTAPAIAAGALGTEATAAGAGDLALGDLSSLITPVDAAEALTAPLSGAEATAGATAAEQAATGITAQQVSTMSAAQTAEWIASQGGTLAEAAAGALETATQTGLAADVAAAQQAMQSAVDAGFTTESIQAASQAASTANAASQAATDAVTQQGYTDAGLGTTSPTIPTPPGSTAPNAAQTAASALGTAATNALINGAVGAAAGALVDSLTGSNSAGDANNAVAQAALNRQLAILEEQFAHWKTNFKPIEEALAAEASTFGSPAEQERAAGKARADVAQSFANQRSQLQRTIGAYGINPSSGRFAGMERGINLAEAKTDAWAQNTAREREKNLGFGKKLDVIGIGRGIPATVTAGLSGAASQNASLGINQFLQSQMRANRAERNISEVLPAIRTGITSWFNPPSSPLQDYISRFGINNLSLDDPAYG